MTATPGTSGDIVLQFAWNDAMEDLYASWQRQVAATEHAHRATADRLRLRHVLIGSFLVAAATLTAAGALAIRFEPRTVAAVGIDADGLLLGLAAAGSLAAILGIVQTFTRYATRTEGHRIAALRYGSLGREMGSMLALPREARSEPDHALVDARERMRRYEYAAPAIRKGFRKKVDARFDAGTTTTIAASRDAPVSRRPRTRPRPDVPSAARR